MNYSFGVHEQNKWRKMQKRQKLNENIIYENLNAKQQKKNKETKNVVFLHTKERFVHAKTTI